MMSASTVSYFTGWWFQICFIFTIFGEDSHVDLYFSDGLKPPASSLLQNDMMLIFLRHLYQCWCSQRRAFQRFPRKWDASRVDWRHQVTCCQIVQNLYIYLHIYIYIFFIPRTQMIHIYPYFGRFAQSKWKANPSKKWGQLGSGYIPKCIHTLYTFGCSTTKQSQPGPSLCLYQPLQTRMGANGSGSIPDIFWYCFISSGWNIWSHSEWTHDSGQQNFTAKIVVSNKQAKRWSL